MRCQENIRTALTSSQWGIVYESYGLDLKCSPKAYVFTPWSSDSRVIGKLQKLQEARAS